MRGQLLCKKEASRHGVISHCRFTMQKGGIRRTGVYDGRSKALDKLPRLEQVQFELFRPNYAALHRKHESQIERSLVILHKILSHRRQSAPAIPANLWWQHALHARPKFVDVDGADIRRIWMNTACTHNDTLILQIESYAAGASALSRTRSMSSVISQLMNAVLRSACAYAAG